MGNITNIYKYLEEQRNRYQNDGNTFSLPIDEIIFIEGKEYKNNIWSESHQGNKLIIFKLEPKSLISSKAYCIGLEVSENGINKNLTNENLWEIGIP